MGFLLFRRQGYGKTDPAVAAGNPNPAPVFLRDSFRDGEAKTIVVAVAVSRFINAEEPVEQMIQFFGRDLRTFIAYGQYGRMSLLLQRQFDLVSGRVADRVVQEDRHQLCQLCLAAGNADILSDVAPDRFPLVKGKARS